MSLQTLAQIVTPPTDPVDSGSVDEWLAIEEKLGTPLPTDYKEYINTYGTGTIGSFLWPYNPFSNNENLNLITRIEQDLSALRQIKDEFGEEEVPYPLYPETGGLLSWAISDNGDVLYWLTQGNREDWRIVINESRGPWFEQFEESTTSFLTKLASGDLVTEILGDLPENASFQPLES
jgi:hypothetical protein